MIVQKFSEWIDWDGGPWEGDPDAIVHVRFKDGVESVIAGPAGEIAPNWIYRKGRDTSIIAYRIAEA